MNRFGWAGGSMALALAALTSRARAEDPPTVAPGRGPVVSDLETVVRGRPEPPDAPREDRAAAASIILPEDSPRALDDLGSLLLEVPGVTVVRTGSIGTFSSLALRGANPDEVRIYLDGVPLNLAAGGAIDVSTLPLGDVERIEVYRGTTPLAFGESALGGIVSIATRTPGAARVTARAGGGSFGTAFADLTAGGRAGRLRLYLGLHGLSSLGDYPYRNDNMTPLNPTDDIYGPRQNDDVRQADGVARAALTLGGRRVLTLGLIGFARDQGLTSTGGNPTAYARFRTMRTLATLRYESRDDLGPGGRLTAELFASAERDRLDDSKKELGALAVLRHDQTESAGAAVHLSRPVADWLRAAAVLEARGETYRPENDLAPMPLGLPARRAIGVAGAEIDLRVRRLDLDLIPSARLEAMRDVVSVDAGTAGPLAPIERLLPILRLGLLRPLGASAAVRANVGRYARAPSFLELYGNGTNRLLGSPELLAERGLNADLGVSVDRSGRRAAARIRTTAFGSIAADLIEWQYSPWGQGRAANIGRARIWGLEEEVRLVVGRHARLTGQATYLSATDVSDDTAAYGRQLPFHPRFQTYLRPEWVGVALPGGLELGAYSDGDLRAWSWSDPTNLQSNGTRVLLGAGLVCAHPRSHLRVTASAVNLTDTREVDVTAWSLPGRSVFFALAYAPPGPGEDGAVFSNSN